MIKYQRHFYREATLPTQEQQEELLAPQLGEELKRSEQIALLQSGVENWNAWYDSVPSIHADLTDGKFAGMSLSGVNLVSAFLDGTTFQQADLTAADLRYARLTGTHMQGAILQDAGLEDARLFNADLRSADLRGARLNRADLRRANLEGADLSDAELNGAVYDATFTWFPEGFDPEAAGMVLRK